MIAPREIETGMTMRTCLKLSAACLLLLSAPGAFYVTLALAGQKDGAARLFDACALLTARDIEAGREASDREPGGAKHLSGVGDEAFWTSDGVAGALYVLKGDAYLRISLGGSDDQAVKIDKLKALARKAMARL